LREAVVRVALQRCPGFQFAPVVHPKTTIAADVTIGAGTFVAAGVVINCGSKIGAHVVVNTSASIDHDCHINDFAFVAPGVALAGSVQLMKRSLVGIGSCVIQGTTIGADAIVGVGAAVIDDVAPDTTVVGVPARVTSRRA
jgi:sugar O-acyltransferase (sialic acid O-acetyltransferase NeuD family)